MWILLTLLLLIGIVLYRIHLPPHPLDQLVGRDPLTLPQVSEEFLSGVEVGAVAIPGKVHEGMEFAHPLQENNLPYYHYSLPYQYQESGAWPPGMFSRLRYWQPTFSTGSGWSYWMRPGINYSRWPFGRWVRRDQNYYYINNLNDRSKDNYL